jgi:hypothetical protein
MLYDSTESFMISWVWTVVNLSEISLSSLSDSSRNTILHSGVQATIHLLIINLKLIVNKHSSITCWGSNNTCRCSTRFLVYFTSTVQANHMGVLLSEINIDRVHKYSSVRSQRWGCQILDAKLVRVNASLTLQL